MKNKLFLAIAVLIIVVLAGLAAGFAYFHASKPALALPAVDTSSWKTYDNKKFAYSMKYPPDLTIMASDPSLFSASFPDSYFSSRMKDYDSVTLSVATSCDPTALLEWADTRKADRVTIGSLDFARYYGYGVGAGNHQYEYLYMYMSKSICYRIGFLSRGANDAAIYGGTPDEIRAMAAAHASDAAKIDAIEQAMLSSLTIGPTVTAVQVRH